MPLNIVQNQSFRPFVCYFHDFGKLFHDLHISVVILFLPQIRFVLMCLYLRNNYVMPMRRANQLETVSASSKFNREPRVLPIQQQVSCSYSRNFGRCSHVSSS